MKCPTYGAGGTGWHIRGASQTWRRVLVESVHDQGRMLIVRPYLRQYWWERITRREAPDQLELGGQEDIPANMVCPAPLIFCAGQPRKRYIPHGSTWCWRQTAKELGEPWDIDPAGAWCVWPSGRRLPVH